MKTARPTPAIHSSIVNSWRESKSPRPTKVLSSSRPAAFGVFRPRTITPWSKAPAILARRGGLTVTACDFMDAGKAQITVEPEVDAALIYGNRLRGRERIINHAAARAQIALNVVTP